MKLLILTQYYPPEMGAPQARLSELARRLHDRGHKITILTAMPNYPTGKVFDGYRRKWRLEEDADGIRVMRTWIWPSKSRKALPRLISYMSFVVSSVLLGLWGLGRQDLVLFESPPLFIVPAGLVIGRCLGARIVMNCSDLWPGTMVRSGYKTGGPLLKALFWLEKFGYEHSDAVAVTNPTAARQVSDRFPHVPNAVISNGVDTTLFRPDLRSETTRAEFGAGPDDFLVGYCGLHGISQGMDVILDAAERLRDREDIKFILIGDGPCKKHLMDEAASRRLTNIAFHDPRPKPQIPPILASCDASLIPLVSRMEGTMPSKFYEAMASGDANERRTKIEELMSVFEKSMR